MVAQILTLSRLDTLRTRFQPSSTTLCFIIAVAISTFYNANFWLGMFDRFEQTTLHSLAFALMFFGVMVLLTFVLLSLFNNRWLLKPIAITLTFSAASIA